MAKNTLFLVLDSLRYDTFVKANTPNFDAVGKTRRVHAFACFTIPSIIGFFMGWPPIGMGEKTLFPEVPKYEWVPRHFKKQGYYTVWLSRNTLLMRLNGAIGGQFSRGFDVFKTLQYTDERTSTAQITADICNITKTKKDHPIFASLLLLDTHRPYSWGTALQDIVPSNPVLNFANQVKAVEYVDSVFPRMKQAFIATGRKTRVIITSDHGELFGPDYWSHDPSSQKCPIQFDEKLFEIPLIIGEI